MLVSLSRDCNQITTKIVTQPFFNYKLCFKLYAMKPEELLSQLSDLEAKLKSFSYEELSLDEASQIKDSFTTFKDRLESKVISPQEKIFSKKNLSSYYQ